MHILDLEKTIVNGVWEGNIGRINRSTIQVWTGKRFTGTRIVNFYTSGSIDDTKLRIYGEDGTVYITYETVEKIEEDASVIKPPLFYTPKENVFVEERLIELLLDRVNELELKDGPPGKDLEFNWNDTELGVRVKGESEYQYVNLKGADGTLDGLTAEQIVTALGYTPANSDNLVEVVDNLETNDATKALSAKQGMELFQSVSNGKSLIAGAITDKGVITSPSDSFQVMAGNIGAISGGGIELVAGDEIIYTNNTLDQVNHTGGSDYTEKVIKKIKSTVSGNIRIKFNLYTSNTSTSYKSRGQIYINDIAEGVLREVVASDGTVIFSEDFDITKDDIISLKIGEKSPGRVTKNDMLTISTNVNPLFKEVII